MKMTSNKFPLRKQRKKSILVLTKENFIIYTINLQGFAFLKGNNGVLNILNVYFWALIE